jgi:hypothetical protein
MLQSCMLAAYLPVCACAMLVREWRNSSFEHACSHCTMCADMIMSSFSTACVLHATPAYNAQPLSRLCSSGIDQKH